MNSSLLLIVGAIALSAGFSISAAAFLSFTVLARMVHRMVAFSVGILLGAALLHMLPEAFEQHGEPHVLFGLLLGGVISFFVLERFAVLRHDHHHEGDEHHHHHGHDAAQAGNGGWPILIGDAIHKAADGIVIAAAFLSDWKLGAIAAGSIIAHEIPQQIGDFMVLLNAGFSRARAYFFNLLTGLAGVCGGVIGWALFERVQSLIPYALVVASSSFIYIALSDLMPQLQREGRRDESFVQLALIGLGVAVIYAVFAVQHGH